MAEDSVRIQYADFDPGEEIRALSQARENVGALASFVGLVRGGEREGGVLAMTLEHYPGMTERALGEIIAEARERWRLEAVRVIHRIGRLEVGERIVLIVVASSHRSDAFSGCEFIMDYLKTRATFWKCEETTSGKRWVVAKQCDEAAAARWQQQDDGLR